MNEAIVSANANELRLGNYLYLYGKIIQVGISDLVHIHTANQQQKENDYKPIGLTHGVLQDVGFEKSEKIEGLAQQWAIGEFVIEEHDEGFYLAGSEFIMGKPFKYLHLLQNIHFALTGIELHNHLPTFS